MHDVAFARGHRICVLVSFDQALLMDEDGTRSSSGRSKCARIAIKPSKDARKAIQYSREHQGEDSNQRRRKSNGNPYEQLLVWVPLRFLLWLAVGARETGVKVQLL